jgi:hypothetical protein
LPLASSRSLDVIRTELSHWLDAEGLHCARWKKPGHGVLDIAIERLGQPTEDAEIVARHSIERYLADVGVEFTVKDGPDGSHMDVIDRRLNYRFGIRLRVDA